MYNQGVTRKPAKPPDPRAPAHVDRRIEWAVLAVIATAAAVLLFWRLGAVYLWQDEANTAVLAARMLESGKPLAYDGTNLLTNDNFGAEETATIGQRTTSADAGVRYVIARGDLRSDSSWIFQPWGQFIAAAAGIGVLGKTTLAPRLPFALAGLATVLVLFWVARRGTGQVHVALLAAALLVANAGWMLHSRQARYYALSGLFLLLTIAAYERWQRGVRFGAAIFIATAWLWFQIDYGTFWPVMAVLFGDAFIRHRHRLIAPLVPAAILAATIAPFIVFYQLAGRLSAQVGPWAMRARENVFYINRYVVSIIILAVAIALLWRSWRRLNERTQRLLSISMAILVLLLLWVPSVAPAAFLRYVVMAAPLGCLVTAWTVMRLFGSTRPATGWLAGAVVAITPWITLPFDGLAGVPQLKASTSIVRPELRDLVTDVFVPRRDPNRIVIDWLRGVTAPTDAILVNYEDAPLMYYLPNPIRGGVAAFRAEDHASGSPAAIVLRRSVPFVHWPVFLREMNRYDLEIVPLAAPDVVWGNNPDPLGKIQDPNSIRDLFAARVRGIKTR